MIGQESYTHHSTKLVLPVACRPLSLCSHSSSQSVHLFIPLQLVYSLLYIFKVQSYCFLDLRKPQSITEPCSTVFYIANCLLGLSNAMCFHQLTDVTGLPLVAPLLHLLHLQHWTRKNLLCFCIGIWFHSIPHLSIFEGLLQQCCGWVQSCRLAASWCIILLQVIQRQLCMCVGVYVRVPAQI